MDKHLVIFGNGKIAELAYYYFTKDTQHKVVAFTAEKEYISSPTFFGLPIIPFNELLNLYPQTDFNLFIALSYSQLNTLRERIYNESKEMGYQLVSYVSNHATVLIEESSIGDNCFILEDNTIQPFVEIGNNVTIWSGNHIGHHSIIKDHCFISSHVVVAGGVTVERNTFLGTNSTLRDGIEVGKFSIIGSNSWIAKSLDEFSISICQATPTKKITLEKGIKLLK